MMKIKNTSDRFTETAELRSRESQRVLEATFLEAAFLEGFCETLSFISGADVTGN